jgi:hypothetical protein
LGKPERAYRLFPEEEFISTGPNVPECGAVLDRTLPS